LHDTVGVDAPWAPTLIKVDGEAAVRAWSGRSMTFPLVRLLGVRSTGRVLAALGRPGEPVEPDGVSRKAFLRLGVGAATAVGLLVNGMTTARASTKDAARAWVADNLDRLPRTYDAVVDHPMAYRRAIWDASAPAVRSRLWVTQFSRYQAAHPDVTAAQRAVLADAIKLASDEAVFADGRAVDARVPALRAAALAAFDRTEGKALFAVLGPDEKRDTALRADVCNCAWEDSWCEDPPTGGCEYARCRCQFTSSGCGTLWRYACNGFCKEDSC
jgi:hypothetical protein